MTTGRINQIAANVVESNKSSVLDGRHRVFTWCSLRVQYKWTRNLLIAARLPIWPGADSQVQSASVLKLYTSDQTCVSRPFFTVRVLRWRNPPKTALDRATPKSPVTVRKQTKAIPSLPYLRFVSPHIYCEVEVNKRLASITWGSTTEWTWTTQKKFFWVLFLQWWSLFPTEEMQHATTCLQHAYNMLTTCCQHVHRVPRPLAPKNVTRAAKIKIPAFYCAPKPLTAHFTG